MDDSLEGTKVSDSYSEVITMKKVTGIAITFLLLTLLCGQVQAATPGSIGWAKTLPDNTTLPKPIVGVVATIVADPFLGYVSYIQDPKGINGIMADSIGVTGQIVEVSGTIQSTQSGERYISGSILSSTGRGQLISPFGMSNKVVNSNIGLGIEGLTATVWGSVTAIGYDDYGYPYFYIDDGSKTSDGTVDSVGNPNIGLRVMSTYADYCEIGDYYGVTGPVGKNTGYDGKPYKVVRELLTYPELVTLIAHAIGGNGQVYLMWDGDPCAGAYRIYRSDTETGLYLPIGESPGNNLAYLDKPLTNETTKWYKVSSLSGNTEGPPSAPVSATTTACAPTVSINTINVDENGILDITFACAPGNGGTAIPMVSLDINGIELWDNPPSGLNGSWCYDTTELNNGTHTVGIKVISANATTGDRYLSYDKKSFVINNDISNLSVSEIADGPTPIQAVFSTDCTWTAKIRQGGNIIGQQSGTGKELDWTWDTSAGYDGEAEVEISYAPVSQATSTMSLNSMPTTKSKFSTFWITSRSLLARPGYYQWAAWYANDQKISSYNAWYWANNFFSTKFNTPINSYSMQLTIPTQFSSVILEDFAQTEEPAKITHVVWSGHGNFGLDRTGANPSFLQANSWLANFVGQGDWWHGVSPFSDYYDVDTKIKITALGPRIGNRAIWKNAGNGRGRPAITQMNRRLKFAVVFGCWSARGTMPLALGIPKKQIPGCKCVYIGLSNALYFPNAASNFSYYLFDALKRGQTAGVAVNYAAQAFAQETGDSARSNPRLFGDPTMKVGRLE